MRVLYYMEKELANFDPSRPGHPNGRIERGELLPIRAPQMLHILGPGLLPPKLPLHTHHLCFQLANECLDLHIIIHEEVQGPWEHWCQLVAS